MVPPLDLERILRGMRTAIGQAAAAMPDQRTYIGKHCRAAG